MRAKDIMTTSVVTVDPEDEVTDVARQLLDRRVSGAPVIDRDEHLIGIISEGDLIRRAERRGNRSWWLALIANKTTEFTRSLGTRVRDVMSHEVVSIDEETPISEVARILEANRIKRVPVLRGDRLVGIVSRADVLRGLATLESLTGSAPSVDDREVRARVLELLRKQTSVSLQAVSIIVVNSTVYLWGIASTADDKDAIRVAAENVAGAAKVHDFLDTLPGLIKEL